jgi:D-alanyl-D-alanine carboxypeptidase
MATRRRFIHGLIGGMALFALLGSSPGARADEVDDYIRSEMRDQHIPGLSVAVVRSGRVVKAQGYGLASIELNAPATADTVYPLASITKPFTAAAVLLLAQEGRLGLDDKISRYVEKTPAAWGEVTIRQLLAHTSGIKDHLNEMHGKTCNGTSPEEITSYIATLPLNFAPGSQWLYSNTGYLLLQIILQKVSGKPFDELLAERVFGPLGMKATRRNSLDEIIPNRAAGYLWEGGRLRNSPFLEPTLYDNADAGLLSSVLDLARWDAALYQDGILNASSRERMWTPVKLASGSTFPYGLGWHLEDVHGHRLVYHEGNRQDGSSVMARYPEDKLTVIVLTNLGNAATTRISRHLAGLYVPALAAADRPIADAEPRVTARIKAVLLAIQAGTIDPAPFTQEMWQGFYPAGVQGFQQALRSFGAFKSITLLAREAKGDARSYRYQVTFGETTMIIDFTLTKDDRISELTGGQQ